MRAGRAAMALASWLAIVASVPAVARDATTQTRQSQAAMTPDEALHLLEEGNARFVAGRPLARDLMKQVKATSGGQYPFAAVLGCIDSRVPPELVFDTGIGDIFSTRTAGNVLDDEILGGLEFAAKVSGVKLIVVLGHTQCGAVKGACDGVHLGHLTDTLALLQPALEASQDQPLPHDSKNAAYVQHVSEENVRLTSRAIVERSPILADLVRQGKLRVVPAMYEVATGRVDFLEAKRP
jgi:carbonic anhydrase